MMNIDDSHESVWLEDQCQATGPWKTHTPSFGGLAGNLALFDPFSF